MKGNLNTLNIYPNSMHNKHFKCDEFEIWVNIGGLVKKIC